MSVAYKRWNDSRLHLAALQTLDDAWPGKYHGRDAVMHVIPIPGGLNEFIVASMVRRGEVEVTREPNTWAGTTVHVNKYRITEKGRAALKAMRG